MSRQPFNADQRSSERESAPTIIGGKEFYPVRMTNKVMRAVRALAREADPVQREVDAAERRVESLQLKVAQENGKPDDARDAATLDALKAELVEAEEAVVPLSEKQQDASVDLLFRQLRLLLRDSEGDPADPEFMADNLDTREAGPLMEWLMGSDEGNAQEPEGQKTPTSA